MGVDWPALGGLVPVVAPPVGGLVGELDASPAAEGERGLVRMRGPGCQRVRRAASRIRCSAIPDLTQMRAALVH